jgi:hypothetical protein
MNNNHISNNNDDKEIYIFARQDLTVNYWIRKMIRNNDVVILKIAAFSFGIVERDFFSMNFSVIKLSNYFEELLFTILQKALIKMETPGSFYENPLNIFKKYQAPPFQKLSVKHTNCQLKPLEKAPLRSFSTPNIQPTHHIQQ